jgi:hypothetical protein
MFAQRRFGHMVCGRVAPEVEPPMVAFGHIGMTVGSFSDDTGQFMVMHGNIQIRMRFLD